MKDYKFRGMDIAGDWHYGNLAVITKKMGLTEPGYYISNAVGKPFAYMVRPETVGQYTGLKDRNGKEIYEGDILDGSYVSPMSGGMLKRHYLVVMERGVYYAELIGHHPYGTTLLYFENLKSEVIGSRWDNPDLLEGEKI